MSRVEDEATKGVDSRVGGTQFLGYRGLARDMFIGRRRRRSGNKSPGDAWVERSQRARRLREAIQMRDSGTLSEEEFASLTSRLLEGGPVPERPDRAPETPGTRG